jgi:hypothetical protein
MSDSRLWMLRGISRSRCTKASAFAEAFLFAVARFTYVDSRV